MVALGLLLSLAVDYGRAQVAKTELMRAADAAARAAAANVPADLTAARATASQFAALNSADGSAVNLLDSDIVFGSWDPATKTFTALNGVALANANAVQVTARRSTATGNAVPLMLASLFGRGSCDVHATVVAISAKGPNAYGIIGLDWVTMNGGASTDSYKSGDGPYSAGLALQNGSVASNGDIRMTGGATIHGDASPGPGCTASGGYVTGSTTSLASFLSFPNPDAADAKFVNNNASVADFVKNGSFSVSGNCTIDFHAGVYYFHDFSATGGAIINANIDGPVTIYVENSFTLTGGSSAYQAKAQNLKVVALNSGSSVTLGGNADIYIDVYAPLSDVTISGTGALYGDVVGKTATLSGRAGIHFDESSSTQTRKIVTVK
jgi:hypothetical protein